MKNIKLFYVPLGCDENLVDTEKMLGLLNEWGITSTDGETEADAILVNTCCFIGSAKEKNISTALDVIRYKEEGNLKTLLVAGCLAQRYRQEALGEVPEMDTILGTISYGEMARVSDRVLAGRTDTHLSYFHDLNELPQMEIRRVVTTGGHYAFLKIAGNCDKRCTYCITPYLRDPYRSIPVEQLAKEAKQLAEADIKELVPVAREATLYGRNPYGERCLPRLLRELTKTPGICRICIQYRYPEEIADGLIGTIWTEEKVYSYLDIPTQHTSDRILKRIGRRTNREELMEYIGKLRQEIPNIAIRITLISGFPEETGSGHEELMDFVNGMEFERLGVFVYPVEEGTPAFSCPDQVPEEMKEEHRDGIIELQQDIAFEHCENMVGRVLTIFIERKVVDEPAYVGRAYMDTPDVDGLIPVSEGMELMPDDSVRAKVAGAVECDLVGKMYGESAQ